MLQVYGRGNKNKLKRYDPRLSKTHIHECYERGEVAQEDVVLQVTHLMQGDE